MASETSQGIEEKKEESKNDKIITEDDLLNYILEKKMFCQFCHNLKNQVKMKGLPAIDSYEGFICGGVLDIQLRYWNLKKGR